MYMYSDMTQNATNLFLLPAKQAKPSNPTNKTNFHFISVINIVFLRSEYQKIGGLGNLSCLQSLANASVVYSDWSI